MGTEFAFLSTLPSAPEHTVRAAEAYTSAINHVSRASAQLSEAAGQIALIARTDEDQHLPWARNLRAKAPAVTPTHTATSPGPLVGSLCSGYGGLDLGVLAVLGRSVAWHTETEPGPSAILSRHWPGVPNLGDITTVNCANVPRVCVLTAGFPCQRRLGRRPPRRAQPRSPIRSLAARGPRRRGPAPAPPGGRECTRTPHLPRRRRLRWRGGTLPVVPGRRPNPETDEFRQSCR
nr:DNA cytosine methyltransferase [Streptomyces sp. NRRL WC-3742]